MPDKPAVRRTRSGIQKRSLFPDFDNHFARDASQKSSGLFASLRVRLLMV
jgi:hypothetical protein